jgi:hypothetical protein
MLNLLRRLNVWLLGIHFKRTVTYDANHRRPAGCVSTKAKVHEWHINPNGTLTPVIRQISPEELQKLKDEVNERR